MAFFPLHIALLQCSTAVMLHWEGRMKTGPKWPVNRSQYVPLQICLYQHFFFKRPYLGNETRYLRSVSAKLTATYRASIHSFMKVTWPHFYPLFWPFSWKKALFRGVPGGPNWATTVQNMPQGVVKTDKKENLLFHQKWAWNSNFCEPNFQEFCLKWWLKELFYMYLQLNQDHR